MVRAPAPAPAVAIPHIDTTSAELRELDLDKAWDGVNYCLKQVIAPGRCKNLFDDGTAVGDIELYCGPAMTFTHAEVAAIARCYREVDAAGLLAAFVSSRMKDVYLSGLWSRDDEDARSCLVEHFEDLKAFVLRAAADRVGILVFYS